MDSLPIDFLENVCHALREPDDEDLRKLVVFPNSMWRHVAKSFKKHKIDVWVSYLHATNKARFICSSWLNWAELKKDPNQIKRYEIANLALTSVPRFSDPNFIELDKATLAILSQLLSQSSLPVAVNTISNFDDLPNSLASLFNIASRICKVYSWNTIHTNLLMPHKFIKFVVLNNVTFTKDLLEIFAKWVRKGNFSQITFTMTTTSSSEDVTPEEVILKLVDKCGELGNKGEVGRFLRITVSNEFQKLSQEKFVSFERRSKNTLDLNMIRLEK